MRKLIENLAMLALYLLIFGTALGCSSLRHDQVIMNDFHQTDYDYNCLDGTKTFSQTIVCMMAQDDAEKAQNKVTNDLLEKKIKK